MKKTAGSDRRHDYGIVDREGVKFDINARANQKSLHMLIHRDFLELHTPNSRLQCHKFVVRSVSTRASTATDNGFHIGRSKLLDNIIYRPGCKNSTRGKLHCPVNRDVNSSHIRNAGSLSLNCCLALLFVLLPYISCIICHRSYFVHHI